MRILMISNLYPPYFLGGYELLCANVVHDLQELGHDIHVLTSSYGLTTPVQERNIDRILKLYIPFGQPASMARQKRKRTHRFNYAVATRKIAEIKPDIVFVWSQLRLTLGAGMAAQDMGVPVAFTMNDEHIRSYIPARKRSTGRQLLRTLLDATLYRLITTRDLALDHVTCISGQLKQSLLDSGLPIEKAEVIYQGIPLKRFPLKKHPADLHNPIRLCYVGQLHEYKGVHLAVSALGQLNQNNPGRYQLTIVGTGDASYMDQLQTSVKDLSIDQYVHFVGRVENAQVPQYYRQNDILLLTSTWEEPFGLTHLESMASGTVVISTFRGGMKEFLRDEENCLIFDPEQERHLATQIERLVHDDTLRRRLVQTAREMVISRFSVGRYVNDLEQFLQRAIKKQEQLA